MLIRGSAHASRAAVIKTDLVSKEGFHDFFLIFLVIFHVLLLFIVF